MAIYLDHRAVSFDLNFDNFFGHGLYFFEANVGEDIIDGGGEESEGKHDNGEDGDSLDDEGSADKILHDVERPD